MAQNSTQITGIAFSELKEEKKQLVTENEGKMFFFCQNSIGIDLSCRQISNWIGFEILVGGGGGEILVHSTCLSFLLYFFIFLQLF